jgi:hypothetical protein
MKGTDLHQQIIKDRLDGIRSHLKVDEDQAMLHLVYSLVSGASVSDLDENDITDGGQDKQIDAIVINQDGDEAHVFVIQTTLSDSFSSNKIIAMRNGLNWLFLKSKSDYESLPNISLRDKIGEYRSVQRNIGPSNIKVSVIFASLADTVRTSEEFTKEKEAISDNYCNGAFMNFTVQVLGAREIVELINHEERRVREVNANLKIIYDTNNPSLMRYYASSMKGLVCTVPAAEIARLVVDDITGAIFDLNVRKFLGDNGVNREIRATCSDFDGSKQFWFLNNGITIVCNSFDPVADPDDPHVKIKNLQIVNGCQTASTLAAALESGDLRPETKVIVRVYEIQDPSVIDQIVLSTNNQTKITNRDLRANDPIQLDIQRAFNIYGYFFERKPKEFDKEAVDAGRIISNEFAAQSVLSVILRRPSDARRRKYKVWSEYYDQVFKNRPVQHFILAAVIAQKCKHWIMREGLRTSGDEEIRKLAKNCQMHLARIVTFKWKRSDSWELSDDELDKLIQKISDDPESFNSIIDGSFHMLKNIIHGSEFASDLDGALKSYNLDAAISKALHKADEFHVEKQSDVTEQLPLDLALSHLVEGPNSNG